MAHEITRTDSLVLTKDEAWHGLGTVVENAPTPYEAMHLAGLTWEVVKAPLKCRHDGKYVDMPNRFALVRNDTKEVVGNCVTNKYEVKQNISMFDDIYEVANSDDGIEIETAGSLRGGQTVFALVRLGTMGLRNGDDQIKQYAFFRMGHTGFDSYTIRGTNVRVVCGNTEGMALADQCIKVRHMGQRIQDGAVIDEIQAHLGDIKAQAKVFERQMEVAIDTEWDESMLAQYFTKVWSKANGGINKDVESQNHQRMLRTIENWKEYATEHPYQEDCYGTAYAAYQAVTQHATHDTFVRNTGNGIKDARLVSVLEGRGREVSDAAHSVLVDAAGLPTGV